MLYLPLVFKLLLAGVQPLLENCDVAILSWFFSIAYFQCVGSKSSFILLNFRMFLELQCLMFLFFVYLNFIFGFWSDFNICSKICCSIFVIDKFGSLHILGLIIAFRPTLRGKLFFPKHPIAYLFGDYSWRVSFEWKD